MELLTIKIHAHACEIKVYDNETIKENVGTQ